MCPSLKVECGYSGANHSSRTRKICDRVTFFTLELYSYQYLQIMDYTPMTSHTEGTECYARFGTGHLSTVLDQSATLRVAGTR